MRIALLTAIQLVKYPHSPIVVGGDYPQGKGANAKPHRCADVAAVP